MNANNASLNTSRNFIPTTDTLAEGKTKIIQAWPDDPSLAVLQAKDDITGGDGARHEVIQGKAELATDTTCNVFRLLKECGVPVAFEKQLNATSFLAPLCDMIPYEVVIRREAHGSYLKRAKHLHKGQIFPKLILEFFLKTSDKQWQGHTVPKDDPFIQFKDNKIHLYRPDVPLHDQEAHLVLDDYPLKDRQELFSTMGTLAKQTFLTLEKAWQQVGRTLVDFKVEFGFDKQGNLLLADVIDNDSWRVLEKGAYLDKQVFRDGGDLNAVSALYKRVRDLTTQFTIPKQQLVIWRGSVKDDISSFEEFFEPYKSNNLHCATVTTSMHKSPVAGYEELQQLVQQTPDTVVIAYIGRSNGAGPTLSANTSVPVITVPAGWKSFPEDVWSSLRTPSDTPVMTILEPKNAMLAALNILALRNPAVYAQLRLKQEKRLYNFATV